jgi:hypothetical protein
MSLFKGTHMRRIDLVTATLEGWSRLNPQQRQRFFEAGLKAALRLRATSVSRLVAAKAQEPAARRSGRSDALHNFGFRHGLAAETIALEGGRCRSLDRAVVGLVQG